MRELSRILPALCQGLVIHYNVVAHPLMMLGLPPPCLRIGEGP